MIYVIMHTYLFYFLLSFIRATNVFHLLINISLHNDMKDIEVHEMHDLLSINLLKRVDIVTSTLIPIPALQMNSSFCFKEIWATKDQNGFSQKNTSISQIVSIFSSLGLLSPFMSLSSFEQHNWDPPATTCLP